MKTNTKATKRTKKEIIENRKLVLAGYLSFISIGLVIEITMWSKYYMTFLGWMTELIPIWVGGVIGISGILYLLHYYHKIKPIKFNLVEFAKILIGVFRVIELILVLTHPVSYTLLAIENIFMFFCATLLCSGFSIWICTSQLLENFVRFFCMLEKKQTAKAKS